MTNGEKIKEIFPSIPINVSEDTVYCGKSKAYIGEFSKDWWNAEYIEPTAKNDLRWISVKDRLPEKSEYGDVLVTFIPPAGALWATVMVAHYSDLMGIAKPCFHIHEVGKKHCGDITPQVIAWMSLPKPCKEGE